MFLTKRQRGFTLLEALIVLVLTSLISLLLIQGFNQVLSLRIRVITYLTEFKQRELQQYWFRSSVSSLIADYEDNTDHYVFKGEEYSFSGLTLAALTEETGMPVGIQWQLEVEQTQTSLRYTTLFREQTWTIISWLNTGDSHFAYLASDGQWHTQWPPATASALETPQLPVAIQLNGWHRQQPFVWIVQIKGRRLPRLDYRTLDLE